MQLTGSALDSALADLVATGATFDPTALYVGVATAINNRGLNTQLSDVTEATGAMATRKEITAWQGPFLLNNGNVYYQGPEMVFHPASTSEAQIISNWFLATASTAGSLVGFGDIAPAVNLPGPLNALTFVMRLVLDATGTWSLEQYWNG